MSIELEFRARRWMLARLVDDRHRSLVHHRARAALDLGARALSSVSWASWLALDDDPQLDDVGAEHVEHGAEARVLVRIVEDLAAGKRYVDRDGVSWEGRVWDPGDPRLAVVSELAALAGVHDNALDEETARRSWEDRRRQGALEVMLIAAIEDMRAGQSRSIITEDIERPGPALRPTPRRRGPPATPAARQLAREAGVSIERVRGTGRRGRIGKADVLDLLERRAERRAEREAQLEADSMPPGEPPFDDSFEPPDELEPEPPFEPPDELFDEPALEDLIDDGDAFAGLDEVFREAELETIRRALSGVARVDGRFDLGVVADLLAGSRTGCLVHTGLASTRTFGALASRPRSWIAEVLRVCEVHGLVEELALTDLGRSVMIDATPIQFRLPDPAHGETT